MPCTSGIGWEGPYSHPCSATIGWAQGHQTIDKQPRCSIETNHSMSNVLGKMLAIIIEQHSCSEETLAEL